MQDRIENRECVKISFIRQDGTVITTPKKKYKTEKEAIKGACIMNSYENTIHKFVAYKCPVCHSWHIGRNKTELTLKEKEHYKQLLKYYYK